MLLVPFLTGEYDQTFDVQLGGDGYVMDARWNERAQLWTFDLTRDADQVQLLAGVPLLSGQDVLAPYALGIGGIIVTDLSGAKTDAGPDDLNDRVIAAYFTRDEMAFLAAAGIPGVANPGLIPPVPGSAGTPGFGTGTPQPPTPGGGTGGGSVIVEGGTTNVNVYNLSGGQSFSDMGQFPDADATGSEVVVMQFVLNAGANPNPTLNVAFSMLANGSGTVRVYVGGAFETLGDYVTPSGALVDTETVSGTGPIALLGTVANPGGLVPVIITCKSAAPATTVGIGTASGIVA